MQITILYGLISMTTKYKVGDTIFWRDQKHVHAVVTRVSSAGRYTYRFLSHANEMEIGRCMSYESDIIDERTDFYRFTNYNLLWNKLNA